MPLTLAIEVSNPSTGHAGIAIGSREQGSLGSEPVNSGDGRTDDLASAIDRLTRRLNLEPRGLSRIAVSTGPGGYTSLRIAVATAKMICEATGAECIAIPTARIAALRAKARGPFAVVLASKDNTAYATAFATPTQQVGEGHLIDAAAVATLGVSTLIADSFLPPAIHDAATAARITLEPLTLDPAACLELSFDAPAIDPIALLPIYPREPEAVTKWRLKKPKP